MVGEAEKETEVRVKVIVNGKETEATQINFVCVTEPWAEYTLPDGRTARVKVVVTKVFRTDAVNEDGTPVYSFQSQNIIAIDEKPAQADGPVN